MKHARLSGVLVLCLGSACADQVEGELVFVRDGQTSRVFGPRYCVDGNSLGFFGVQLWNDDGATMEFFRDGEDPALLFYAHGDEAFDLSPADCSRFHGKLEREYSRVTGCGEVRGRLAIDCIAPDGLAVFGSVSFEECGEPDDGDDDDDFFDDDDLFDDDDFFDDD